MTTPPDPDLPTKAYEPTEAEASTIAAVRERKRGRSRAPAIRCWQTKSNSSQLGQ